jgi:hypothetical protein
MIVDGYTMRVKKVLVSDKMELQKAGNIITPTRRVRLILENGAIFDRAFLAFHIDEGVVVKNFEKEEDQWKLYEPNNV